MKQFKDMEEVEEWLAPFDYEDFWDEIRLFSLDLPSREKCDEDIFGGASEETVLRVVKRMAQLMIIRDQDLPTREHYQWRWSH